MIAMFETEVVPTQNYSVKINHYNHNNEAIDLSCDRLKWYSLSLHQNDKKPILRRSAIETNRILNLRFK